MTEVEWIACTDPQPMLSYLCGVASDRKMRLFACACCRRIWHLLTHKRSRKALRMVEGFVEGQVGELERIGAIRSLERDAFGTSGYLFTNRCAMAAVIAAGDYNVKAGDAVARAAQNAVDAAPGDSLHRKAAVMAELCAQVRFIHCIFGSPFRHASLPPDVRGWNDGTVGKIATTTYEERAFDRLPILADALEDAGCDNADILAHCRGPGPHVRGCWVVDLLLGKQ